MSLKVWFRTFMVLSTTGILATSYYALNISTKPWNVLKILPNTPRTAQNMSTPVRTTTTHISSTTAQILSTTTQTIPKILPTPEKSLETSNCSPKPDGLKKINESTVVKFKSSINETEKENPLVIEGGHFKPSNCIGSKVAILIPYRNRLENLYRFLHFMHPALQHQQLEYKIFVINQSNEGKFNRAKLLNIGFVEAIKDFDAECFVFHDVDTILLDGEVTYSCSLPTPRHLTSFKRTYLFGGVTQMTKTEFTRVNGYPNRYWGWGGEDDDIFERIKGIGLKVYSDKNAIEHFYRTKHKKDVGNEKNPERFTLLSKAVSFMTKDGLNSLKYQLISHEAYKLYTNITVNVVKEEETQLTNKTDHSNKLKEDLNYKLKV